MFVVTVQLKLSNYFKTKYSRVDSKTKKEKLTDSIPFEIKQLG
jgi:hypothetical protein